jgi:A/G-specific adenine glycosylase
VEKSLDKHEIRLARRALLRWFDGHARPLPWRRTPTPYRIWVSEVMLQQTQVAAVVPYFNRFLRAFPSVRSLARARRERVLELWSGLGYYRRARDLHRAAQLLARRFGGRFPKTYEAARALPGVGDYTARAVLSIGFNQPYAVLDGNVARVVARWRAIGGHIHQPSFRGRAARLLDRWLSRRRPGAFNQALMELGQTRCLPRAPRCPACPLAPSCLATKRGRPESYPAPRPRRPTERRLLAVAAIHSHGKFALVRGLDENLLPELWNFPSAFGRTPAAARRALAAKLARLSRDGVSAQWPREVNVLGNAKPRTVNSEPAFRFSNGHAEFRHTITHRSIRVQVYAINAATTAAPVYSRRLTVDSSGQPLTPNHRPRTRSSRLRWLSISDFDSAAVSALARKVAASLERSPSADELSMATPVGPRLRRSIRQLTGSRL